MFLKIGGLPVCSCYYSRRTNAKSLNFSKKDIYPLFVLKDKVHSLKFWSGNALQNILFVSHFFCYAFKSYQEQINSSFFLCPLHFLSDLQSTIIDGSKNVPFCLHCKNSFGINSNCLFL